MNNYELFKGKVVSATELHAILEKSKMPFSIPVDIEKLIQSLGIEVSTRPDFKKLKVLGSINIVDSKPIIWINKVSNQIEERKRFTLAHELGHFMLHIAPLASWTNENFTDKKIGFNRDDEWDYKEMEANRFAAQLLMPADAVRDNFITDELKESSRSIERMSKIFHVSKIAMKYRLETLGLIA